MSIDLDELDFRFIINTLCRAELVFEELECSHDVCAANRDRHREDARMARQARKMMYDAKKKGGAK